MFIDNPLNLVTRAPAERNVPDISRKTNPCFAPLEREKSFDGRALYKHLAPLGRRATNVMLRFQREFAFS